MSGSTPTGNESINEVLEQIKSQYFPNTHLSNEAKKVIDELLGIFSASTALSSVQMNERRKIANDTAKLAGIVKSIPNTTKIDITTNALKFPELTQITKSVTCNPKPKKNTAEDKVCTYASSLKAWLDAVNTYRSTKYNTIAKVRILKALFNRSKSENGVESALTQTHAGEAYVSMLPVLYALYRSVTYPQIIQKFTEYLELNKSLRKRGIKLAMYPSFDKFDIIKAELESDAKDIYEYMNEIIEDVPELSAICNKKMTKEVLSALRIHISRIRDIISNNQFNCDNVDKAQEFLEYLRTELESIKKTRTAYSQNENLLAIYNNLNGVVTGLHDFVVNLVESCQGKNKTIEDLQIANEQLTQTTKNQIATLKTVQTNFASELKQRQDLERRIADFQKLEQECNELTEQLDLWKDANNNYAQINAALELKIKQNEETLANLNQRINESDANTEALKQRLTEAEKLSTDLEAAQVNLNMEKNRIEQLNAELQTRYKELSDTFESLRQDHSELQGRYDDVLLNFQDLENDFVEATELIEKYDKIKTGLESDLAKLENLKMPTDNLLLIQLNTVTEQLSEARKKIEQLERTIQENKTTLNNLEQNTIKLNECQETIEGKDAEISALEQKLKTANQLYDALQKQSYAVKQRENTLAHMEEFYKKYSGRENELENIEDQKKELSEKTANIDAKIASVQVQINDLSSTLETVTRQRDSLNEQIRIAKGNLETVTRQRDSFKEQVDILKSSNPDNDLKEQSEEFRQRLSEALVRIQELQNQLAKVEDATELFDSFQDLTNELSKMNNAEEMLQKLAEFIKAKAPSVDVGELVKACAGKTDMYEMAVSAWERSEITDELTDLIDRYLTAIKSSGLTTVYESYLQEQVYDPNVFRLQTAFLIQNIPANKAYVYSMFIPAYIKMVQNGYYVNI